MSEEPRYWLLDASPSEDTSQSSRINEVAAASNWPDVVGLVDEQDGGVIGYLHDKMADTIVERLNGIVPDGAPETARDHAPGEPGQEATEPGASREGSRETFAGTRFGRVVVVLDLGGNTQTLAHSGLIHLDSIMSGGPKTPAQLAESLADAIEEAVTDVNRTVDLFGCQGILEKIETETSDA